MPNNLKTVVIVSALTALVVVGLAVMLLRANHVAFGSTASAPTCGGTVSCTTGSLYVSDTLYGNVIAALTNALVPGILYTGGTSTSTSTSFAQTSSIGTCNLASSTIATVLNPFAATSTLTLESLVGTGNPTSTTLQVGTSTKATGLVASDVYAILDNGVVGSTSPFFYTSAGIVNGPIQGYVSAGASSVRTVVVGPAEYAAVYATSTYGTTGAINYVPGFTSCTYKFRWGT